MGRYTNANTFHRCHSIRCACIPARRSSQFNMSPILNNNIFFSSTVTQRPTSYTCNIPILSASTQYKRQIPTTPREGEETEKAEWNATDAVLHS